MGRTEEFLGSGMFGTVFSPPRTGKHRGDRRFAMKLFRNQDDREIENVALVSSTLSTREKKRFCLPVETGDGFMVMPRGDRTLLTYAIDPRTSFAALLRTLLLCFQAVTVLTAHGFVHTDLKPNNVVMFGKKNPKILDFGTLLTKDTYREIGDRYYYKLNYWLYPPEVYGLKTNKLIAKQYITGIRSERPDLAEVLASIGYDEETIGKLWEDKTVTSFRDMRKVDVYGMAMSTLSIFTVLHVHEKLLEKRNVRTFFRKALHPLPSKRLTANAAVVEFTKLVKCLSKPSLT